MKNIILFLLLLVAIGANAQINFNTLPSISTVTPTTPLPTVNTGGNWRKMTADLMRAFIMPRPITRVSPSNRYVLGYINGSDSLSYIAGGIMSQLPLTNVTIAANTTQFNIQTLEGLNFTTAAWGSGWVNRVSLSRSGASTLSLLKSGQTMSIALDTAGGARLRWGNIGIQAKQDSMFLTTENLDSISTGEVLTVVSKFSDRAHVEFRPGGSGGSGGSPTGAAGGDLTGTYPNPTIGTGKVISANVLDGTLVNADLASQTVDSNKIKNRAITTVKLATNAVDSTKAANLSPNDLAQTGANTNDVLTWTGTKYAPRPSSGGSGITALTGDVTASGTGSVVATIANNSVTSAKVASQTLDSTDLKNRGTTLLKLAQSGASNGQVPKYNATTGNWEPGADNSGSSVSIVPDTFGLPEIKEFIPAVGISANESVTNYTSVSIDAVRYKFSTAKFGFGTSTEYGGWLANGTSNDSISVTAPFGVVVGDSQPQGAPGRGSRLDPKGASVTYTATYPDSVGQLSYHLRQLTRMRWYNHGIGGQTSRQVRARFARDVLGQNVNTGDGRPNQTLPGKPYIAVIIAGINDVFGSITPQEIIENLRWMAASCNENGIKCVVLNLPGDEAITYTIARNLEIVNKFLNEGGLDSYNAKVVDYNTWWKNPVWNSLDKQSSLIVDDIHPSMVGYDSLANYIFRRANLPVLSKLVVSTELAPTGFTGFSRPNSVNLNGVTYAIASSEIDTLEIANLLKDTVWIKINASTNVTGTSYSGFSHLQWFLDNNPTNRQYYTKRRGYAAPTGASILNSLKITAESYANVPRLAILFPALENAFSVTTGGSVQVDIGYGQTFPNSEMLRVHGAVGISSNIFAQQDAKIGNLQILRSGFPTTTGAGITAGLETLAFYYGAGGVTFGNWLGNSATRVWSSGSSANITGVFKWRDGFSGTLTPNGNQAIYHEEMPILNMFFSGGVTSAKYVYRRYNPTLTSLPAGIQHVYIENVVGDNLFNTTSGNTGVGVSSTTARLHLGAGTATANTAPLKLTSGTNLATAEAGAVEYDGTEFYTTNSTASRAILARVLKGSATLAFPLTATGTSSSLTITVTGATTSDSGVSIQRGNASISGTFYEAVITGANTVTVYFHNFSGSNQTPASGTFKVTVTK